MKPKGFAFQPFFCQGDPEELEDGHGMVMPGDARAGSCSSAPVGSLAWAGNSRRCAGCGPAPVAGRHRHGACP